MASLSALQQAVSRLGILGTVGLVLRKMRKRKAYQQMLREVPLTSAVAKLKDSPAISKDGINPQEVKQIFERAEAMLRGENIFFTFPYKTRAVKRPWEFDPIENKYWPTRHYTEQVLHAADTPRDVKIVWEINRFKDLTTLGQAAFLTRDKKYADEVERRLISWIEENPFANTINWASALEISIRLISWTATLLLLREAGLGMEFDTNIARSIYEQARYLAGDLSTDKVVPTNHLIGEAAGLFLISTLWDFPSSERFADIARSILEAEIICQTYPDGATREASSWYHQFVTHFFDLVDRVAARTGAPMSAKFEERIEKMKTYLSAVTVGGEVVRYGDADDGWALFFEGDVEAWKSKVFCEPKSKLSSELAAASYFPEAQHVAVHASDSFLFVRAGEFGMGGAGYSSHAHDDFLSPILYMHGLPVLADPGTFVYNGDPSNRAKYRGADAHNGLQIGGGTGAVQRMNFGWDNVRPDARLSSEEAATGRVVVTGQYAEWPEHTRRIQISHATASIVDTFDRSPNAACEWRLHLDPMWSSEETSEKGSARFSNQKGDQLLIELHSNFGTQHIENYDYSPSYRVQKQGCVLCLTHSNPSGQFEIVFSVNRASTE